MFYNDIITHILIILVIYIPLSLEQNSKADFVTHVSVDYAIYDNEKILSHKNKLHTMRDCFLKNLPDLSKILKLRTSETRLLLGVA